MLHHGSVTCWVSTWLHAGGAAFPNRSQRKMTVHLGTSDLVTNHTPSGAETGHAGLWRPDGLVEHCQALVHTVALLTWNQKDTVQSLNISIEGGHIHYWHSLWLGKIPVNVHMSRTTDTKTKFLKPLLSFPSAPSTTNPTANNCSVSFRQI